MKFKNGMIVICLILFILIGISAVSSADNTTNVISNNDNNILTIESSDEDLLKNTNDGSFAELNTKISGDSSTNIVLEKNYTYSNTDTIKTGIEISKNNIVIDGQGHTIDAKGQTIMFEVTGVTVTLKNINFVNGHSNGCGGAIIGHGDNLRIFNCSFINNTADSWGGAVYSAPYSYSVIVNSTFINNKGYYGGAMTLYDDKDTCARHNIINCTFIGNKAFADDFGGGAIFYYDDGWDSNNYVRNSVFINNTAANGGAIYSCVNSMINITDSIFIGNSAKQVYSFAYHTYADYNWWGNTVDNKSSRPDVDEHVKVNNWLYFDVIPNIQSSSALISINNLYDNATGETNIYETSKLPSIDVGVTSKNATLSANTLTLDHSGKSLVNCIILGDYTLTAGYNNIKVSKTMKSGSFTELQSLIDNAVSDEIILEKDYTFIIGIDNPIDLGVIINKPITINGNGHTINGAGKSRIFYINRATDVTLENIIIANGNYYGSNGGAGVLCSGVNTNFINCTFINNYADSAGGGAALHIVHSLNTKISDCKFINNTEVYNDGGAIYIDDNSASIINTLFENNHARTRGGAVYNNIAYFNTTGSTFTNCTFKNNTASMGGAIYDINYGKVITSITDCIFIANNATSQNSEEGGGAIYAGKMEITNSLFKENYAKTGAAIFITPVNSNDLMEIDKCIFINNTATSNAIILSEYGSNIENSIFLNNNIPHGYIITTIYGGLKTNYNWYGSNGNNYKTMWYVSNLCDMNNWLFLNFTNIVYDDNESTVTGNFNFFVYDKYNDNIMDYNFNLLPSLNLTLSSQNLTLTKNIVSFGETVSADVNYYKGVLNAQCENVDYEIPYKFQIETWIEANSTINVPVTSKNNSIHELIHPFESDYLIFLRNAGRITYISSNSSIVKVDKNGKLTGVKIGVAKVTIRFSGIDVLGRDKYKPSSTVVTVNVTRIHTELKPSVVPNNTLEIDRNPYTFVYSLNPYVSSANLVYSSNDTNVATVSGGMLRTIGEGVANITISYAGDDKHAPCSTYFILTVTKKHASIKLSDTNLTINASDLPYFVGVIVNPHAVLNCTSSNPDVAIAYEENGNYIIKTLKGGLTNITFTFEGNDKYAKTSAKILVKVLDYQTHFDINSTVKLNVTDYVNLPNLFNLKDNDGNKLPLMSQNFFTYESNDSSIVTVDESGYVSAIKEGKASVTIKFNGTSRYKSSNVTVTFITTTIQPTINVKSVVTVYVGQNTNINASLNIPGLKQLNYRSNDTSVVGIHPTNGIIYPYKVGVANITVTYNGTQKYQKTTANVIVNVVLNPTTIKVGNQFSLWVGETETLNAILNPSGAGNLIYISSDDNIVKVDQKGIITAVDEGNATITIRFNGNNKYDASNATVDVSVVKNNITTNITVNDTINLFVGDNSDISAILTPANAGKLNYTSSDEKVVKIDENGVITAVGEGSAIITIKLIPKNNKFIPSSAAVNVVVSKIATEITANPIELNLTESAVLDYIFSHPEAGNLQFVIGDDSIINIENGEIIAKKVGSTNISINFAGNNKYKPSNTTINVNVVEVPVSITVPDSLTVNVTEYILINANLNPNVGSLVYTSLDEGIATVNEYGSVKGIKVGETDILVSFAGQGKYAQTSTKVHVKVINVPTNIVVVDSISLNITEIFKLDANLNPNVGSLVYTSLDEGIATVNEYGSVKGIKVGETDILVSFAGQGKYVQTSTKVHVKVVNVKTEIEIGNTDISIYIDDIANINATLNPSEAGILNYMSSDSNIVSIDENGKMTALKEGKATITITYTGEGKYSSSSKTVNVNVVKIPTYIKYEDMEMEMGLTSNIKPTVEPLNSLSSNLTFSSNNSEVVEIHENGILHSIASGKALITISYAGNEKYLPSQKNIVVTVTPRHTYIEVKNDVIIGYGDSMDLGAVVRSTYLNIDGTLLYESSNPEIVSVDANGKITANKRGNAVITIKYNGQTTPNGYLIYYPSNTTVNVVVESMTTEITVNSNKITLYVDDEFAIDAKLNRPSNGKLTYFSNNPKIATVDADGKITAVGEGTAIITVNYAGNDNYHSSSTNMTVVVKKVSTSIKVNKTVKMYVDDEINLAADVLRTDGRLTYLSSNPLVATVDSRGNINALKSGLTQIVVKLEGDTKYAALEKMVIVNVSLVPTSIKVNPIEMYVGDEFTITNALTPVGAGKLSFDGYNWDIIDVDNKGVVRALEEGTTEIFISFAGNSKYAPSNYTVLVTVKKIEIPSEDCKFSVSVRDELGTATFSVKLPEYIDGTFVVTVDGKDFYSEEIVDGFAKITVEDLKPGQHNIAMRYSGDLVYSSITEFANIYLAKIKIDKNKNIPILYTATGKYIVHLTKDTQAMAGKIVTFYLNGKKITAKTNKNGYAYINVKLPIRAKPYAVSAQFGNVKVSNTISIKSIVVAKNVAVKKSVSYSKILVSLKKVNGKYQYGKKITLKFNGKTFKASTNKKGIATFKISKKIFSKLKVGKSYSYRVTYLKDSVAKKITIRK